MAPVPRPPQPMTPTLISSLPAAYAPEIPERLEAIVPPTMAAVEVLMKSRRDGVPVF